METVSTEKLLTMPTWISSLAFLHPVAPISPGGGALVPHAVAVVGFAILGTAAIWWAAERAGYSIRDLLRWVSWSLLRSSWLPTDGHVGIEPDERLAIPLASAERRLRPLRWLDRLATRLERPIVRRRWRNNRMKQWRRATTALELAELWRRDGLAGLPVEASAFEMWQWRRVPSQSLLTIPGGPRASLTIVSGGSIFVQATGGTAVAIPWSERVGGSELLPMTEDIWIELTAGGAVAAGRHMPLTINRGGDPSEVMTIEVAKPSSNAARVLIAAGALVMAVAARQNMHLLEQTASFLGSRDAKVMEALGEGFVTMLIVGAVLVLVAPRWSSLGFALATGLCLGLAIYPALPHVLTVVPWPHALLWSGAAAVLAVGALWRAR